MKFSKNCGTSSYLKVDAVGSAGYEPRDPQLMIPVAKVERYFPKGFTSDQMQQVIVKLLENYARAHQHGSR